MPRCKAPEILRNEAYWTYAAMTKGEGNVADGRFSAACQKIFCPSAQGMHIFLLSILHNRSILVGSPQISQISDSMILALGGRSVEIPSILKKDSGSASRIFRTRSFWSFLKRFVSSADALSLWTFLERERYSRSDLKTSGRRHTRIPFRFPLSIREKACFP